MKKFLYLFVAVITVFSFYSCIDEDDFDFDSLAQTTINPSLRAPLLNTEITLSDFLDLEQMSDESNGLELRQVNDGNESYLEFSFSLKDSFNVNDFISQIRSDKDAVVNIPQFTIPNLNALTNMGVDLTNSFMTFPDTNLHPEDLSIEIEELEDGIRIDSIYVLQGNLIIQPLEMLPLNTKMEFTSSTVINRTTGEPLLERIDVADVNGGTPQTFSLSNYKIMLKDSIINGETKQFIDLRYRLIFDLGSNTSLTGGDYNLDLTVAMEPLIIDAVFGDVGEAEIAIQDTIALDFLKDSVLNALVDRNGIDFERFYLGITTSTNIGLTTNLRPNLYTVTSDGVEHSVFDQDYLLQINRAPSLGEIGYTPEITVESDANALEVFPDILVYDLKLNFKDTLNTQETYPYFITPNDAFFTLNSKGRLPLKAKLKDLHYETSFDAFGFIEELEYLKTATLNFYIESTFPVELSVNLFLIDSNNVVFDTLLTKPFVIPGARIDSEGHVLTPTGEYVDLTLSSDKYNSLAKADKIKLSAVLNTSKDNQGEQRYVSFSNDAKIKIKASAKVTGNITF